MTVPLVLAFFFAITWLTRSWLRPSSSPASRRLSCFVSSFALKAGLVAVQEALQEQASGDAWLVYKSLDLGPGGYSLAPARRAKEAPPGLLARPRR